MTQVIIDSEKKITLNGVEFTIKINNYNSFWVIDNDGIIVMSCYFTEWHELTYSNKSERIYYFENKIIKKVDSFSRKFHLSEIKRLENKSRSTMKEVFGAGMTTLESTSY